MVSDSLSQLHSFQIFPYSLYFVFCLFCHREMLNVYLHLFIDVFYPDFGFWCVV